MKWMSFAITCVVSFVSVAQATIDVAVKTPECVVFASDARITLSDGSIGSDTYEKIVRVTRYVVVQMAGTALAGNKNLKTTIQDFRWATKLTDTSSLAFDGVISLFRSYCDKNESLGVDYSGLILRFAGADERGNIQLCNYLQFGKRDSLVNLGQDVYFMGNPHYCSRLIQGIDSDLKSDLFEILAEATTDSSKNARHQRAEATIAKYNIMRNNGYVTTSWSLRDAIDYAYMLVKTTLLCDRMSLGKYRQDQKVNNPMTGGDILLCVVTRDGVEWVLSPDLNPSR